jgi:hypothetical protein
MANTKMQVVEYGPDASGAEVAVDVTSEPLVAPSPSTAISYLVWIHNPTGSGIRVYVIPQGSDNTTSGITAGAGETLASLGPFFEDDLPDLIADGAGTVYVSYVGVKSEV